MTYPKEKKREYDARRKAEREAATAEAATRGPLLGNPQAVLAAMQSTTRQRLMGAPI